MNIRLAVDTDRAVDAYTTLRPMAEALDYLAALVHEWTELVEAGELEAEEMLSRLDQWVEEMDGYKSKCILVREALSDQAWAIRRVTGL